MTLRELGNYVLQNLEVEYGKTDLWFKCKENQIYALYYDVTQDDLQTANRSVIKQAIVESTKNRTSNIIRWQLGRLQGQRHRCPVHLHGSHWINWVMSGRATCRKEWNWNSSESIWHNSMMPPNLRDVWSVKNVWCQFSSCRLYTTGSKHRFRVFEL